ncbi:MAG: O-antigen ligase family protein [Planctomycetes bacterium]|nr:O-antigen ligase family protein [Planctomycetota bacterium]
MGFFLFLLVNAALFVRPAEIIPDLLGWNIYLFLILACAAASLPEVVRYFLTHPIDTQPVTLCVFGILAAIALAPLAMMDFEETLRTGVYFLKVVVYYVLLVSLVNAPGRLRFFVGWLLACCLVLTAITLLQYHEVIELQTLKTLTDSQVDRATGEVLYFNRLQGSGIFQDPNDMCMMLAAAAPLCLFLLFEKQNPALRLLWGVELALFIYAIALTRSRGGFLALLAGMGVLAWRRFGWRRTLALGCVGLPLLLLLLDSRQTSISASEGTGRTRVQEWSDWMMEFRDHPLLGKGMSLAKEEDDPKERLPGQELKHLAHNSFLQAYADTGILGGTLFLGAFFFALWSMLRLGREEIHVAEPTMRRLLPFMLGAVAAYTVGLLTLSLCYVVPTYLVLGLAVAFVNVAVCQPAVPALRFDVRVLGRCAVAGVAYLAAMYVFVRLFINWA